MTLGKKQSTVDKSSRSISSRFAVAIRDARMRKGLSLQQLGELTSTSASYINRLENFQRKNPSITVLISLAEELDLNVWELLQLAIDDHTDKVSDVADLFVNSNFAINGKVVNNPGMRGILKEIISMIVYRLNRDVNYRDVMTLIQLIEKFHIEKERLSKEGA